MGDVDQFASLGVAAETHEGAAGGEADPGVVRGGEPDAARQFYGFIGFASFIARKAPQETR